MKFRITLHALGSRKKVLPINYQYPLSAWIYKTISYGNHAFAKFLHEKGFDNGNRSYKLFCFSWFKFAEGGYRTEGDRLHILTNEFSFDISFLAPAAMQHFVSGLFSEQSFTLGDRQSQVPLRVKSIEAMPLPVFEEVMQYCTTSPILISSLAPGARHASYLSPDESQFGKLMTDNLQNKYLAAANAGLINNKLDFEGLGKTSFRLLSEPQSKAILIKANTPQQTRIRAYFFDFEMAIHPVLQQIGYLGGFGEKNSLGLGGLEVTYFKKKINKLKNP
ncbi:MAG: CRISPR-associated endoribonuclease Cas6 [Ignavibacteria bacterium]|nr:CRISPR-associated endoribonuclease Cas6 [Ignavibacteria bacterium]